MSSTTMGASVPDNRSRWTRMSQSQRNRKRVGLALRVLLAVVVLTFSLFPIVWTISAAFNPTNGLSGQTLIPQPPTLDHLRTILTDQPFLLWMLNSIIIGVLATALSVFMTMLAAFSFSRFRFPSAISCSCGPCWCRCSRLCWP
jgi:ABC-type maltose transport system permease subunit